MWNSFKTDSHQGVHAEITTFAAGNGDLVHAYVAHPEGDGPFPFRQSRGDSPGARRPIRLNGSHFHELVAFQPECSREGLARATQRIAWPNS